MYTSISMPICSYILIVKHISCFKTASCSVKTDICAVFVHLSLAVTLACATFSGFGCSVKYIL